MVATLEIPDDKEILAAVGRIALRQGQLDHLLRLTMRDASELGFVDAMRDAERHGIPELRRRIRRIVKQRAADKQLFAEFEALLRRARMASHNHHALFHGLWARNKLGEIVMQGDESIEGRPTIEQLNSFAQALAILVSEFNELRLRGFSAKAAEPARLAG